MSTHMFPLAIQLARGRRLCLGPFFLGSLYRRLDEYHEHMQDSFGRYSLTVRVDLAFLQLFLWERLRGYGTSKTHVLIPRPRFGVFSAL
jgi:hypothetical protein